ncbi:D-alanyl-D-alanine carboxypeptidase [Patescibacteria group bacterium]|nr:D-alanyl-D-alanine carboxypeptidase [Patescibacteria group bacterium]
MSRNIKFFFAAFLISLPFWWGMNVFEKNLENFLFFSFYYQPPPSQVFLAQVSQQFFQAPEKEIPEIEAKSAILVKINKNGSQEILFEKNSDQILPIASLTKLMTSLVVTENYNLSQQLEVTKEAVEQPEEFGNLKIGEHLSVENLLYLVLIESSNDSAFTLSELIGQDGFVDLMNLEAEYLGLFGTHFVGSTGYSAENYSTAKDLVNLAKYIIREKPIIWEISSLSEFSLYTPDGVFHHQLSNTNQLLKEYPEIIGGKTGYTEEARGCIILILKNSKDEVFINIILGSENRFEEMKKLIEYSI